MDRIFLLLFFVFVTPATFASTVLLPSGDRLVLPKGWQVLESHLLKKKIIFVQYKNTILQAKVDADFLINHNHISPKEFFKNKCLDLKKFFSEEQNRTALKMKAEGCALEIEGKNRKFERILLKISPASNLTVVVISSMSLTTDVSALDLGPPAKELENVFFANSSSRRKGAR